MADIEIRDARQHELPIAAAVLSRGMRDNPVHVSVFGPDPEMRREQLERFFSILLRWMPHPPWVGIQHGTIVAVWGMGEPGACQPTVPQKFAVLPLLVFACGVGTTSRALREPLHRSHKKANARKLAVPPASGNLDDAGFAAV